MQYVNNELLFSPSDLVSYIRSPFITWMGRWALEEPAIRALKDSPDTMLAHLAQKGYEHEDRFLGKLREQTASVAVIGADDSSQAQQVEDTLAAMRAGTDVIFQARLTHGAFAGYADFLIKVGRPSNLGSFSYEPWDTKLARSPKAYFIIQLCCYAEMLQSIQGVLPKYLTVVLGNNDKATYRTQDFYAYYGRVKAQFIEQQHYFASDKQPDPFATEDVGDWTSYVEGLRQQRDHLSKIANITRSQIAKFNALGITTCAELVADGRAFLPKINAQIYQRLKMQASIQKKSEQTGQTEYAVLPPAQGEERLGFKALPPHSDSDLFFDLEGFPFIEGGLEFLWGISYFDEGGERRFWERWAHNHEQEKQALIDFVSFAYERWRLDNTMHVYHYGHYEVSVLKRLMGRYGVMESRIDDMLRAGVFVDLYQVVRHAIIIGAPSYSIKKLERLYRAARQTDVASGDESVVVYANWRSSPDGKTWQTSEALKFIRRYNIDDCESTQELVDWLRQVQAASGIGFIATIDSSSPSSSIGNEPLTLEQILEQQLRTLALHENETADNRHIASLLADLIQFYKREDKPTWWRFFERQAMTLDELYDEPDCIVDCWRGENVSSYNFDPDQEFRNRRFTRAYVLGANVPPVKVDEIDAEKGKVIITSKNALPDNISLVQYEYVNKKKLEQAILNVASGFNECRKLRPAIRHFLLREAPRIDPQLLLAIDEARDANKLQLIQRAINSMSETFLSIQGPPGTGKTYTASHVIYALVLSGKRVGISSNSHAAINHLLKAVAQLSTKNQTPIELAKIQNDDDEIFSMYPVEQYTSRTAEEILLENGGAVGFTVWGAQNVGAKLDYLFIDEAGQVAIANLIAMGGVAPNIVVMGDQMQLPQPVQGTHPGDSGKSTLDYLLRGARTILPEKGIFLNRTYRMHQDINRFISTMIYEGRLDNHPDCDNHQIIYSIDSPLPSCGITAIEITHRNNKQHSPEEVQAIRELVNMLSECKFQDKKGTHRSIAAQDILVVAPFNHQVNELKKALGFSARVGTVDLFQGQEAPIVIISMTASQAIESPRGVEFLLSINRLNVAISRAQALAIVVHGDKFLEGSPNKIEDIQRFNLFTTCIANKG